MCGVTAGGAVARVPEAAPVRLEVGRLPKRPEIEPPANPPTKPGPSTPEIVPPADPPTKPGPSTPEIVPPADPPTQPT